MIANEVLFKGEEKMSNDNGGNGNGRVYIMQGPGFFYCSIIDCDGILQIIPDGKKIVERHDDKVVVFVNKETPFEKRLEFPFANKEGEIRGVEIYTSSQPIVYGTYSKSRWN